MTKTNDTNTIVEVVQNDNGISGLSLPQPTLDDVWDTALSGVLSENSKRSYRAGLLGFAKFILGRANTEIPKDNEAVLQLATVLLPHVNFQLVTEYRDELRYKGFAHRTINVRLAAIHSLFNRMMRLGLTDKNPASSELVQRLRTSSRSDTQGLEEEEAASLLELCYKDTRLSGKRDLALFAVLIFNGLRRSEVIQIDMDRIRYIKSTPTIRLKAKRDKDLMIEFIPKVWATIDDWCKTANIVEGPIFVRLRGTRNGLQKVTENRLTPDGIYAIIKSRIKEAGIEKNIHPHSLRHTYATLALLSGVAIQDVQMSMGHSSTDTTYRYYRAVNQVGTSPGRSINLKWPKQGKGKEKAQ